MQVVQAGEHKLIALEFDANVILEAARQAGLDCKVHDSSRALLLELSAASRQTPLLLFDAADPGNLGWFSRCQFYVDGRSGAVMQTPLSIANCRDRSGRALPNVLRLRIAKELPASFHLPTRQPVSEQVVYILVYNFLTALTKSGVAVCGGGAIQPLAGRTEGIGSSN
jgi:hypothetical protein